LGIDFEIINLKAVFIQLLTILAEAEVAKGFFD
jgi:hypothetical protein